MTLNTLVFDHELFGSPSGSPGSGSAIEALQVVKDAQVDALIVCLGHWDLPTAISLGKNRVTMMALYACPFSHMLSQKWTY